MPTYEYKCEDGHISTIQQKFSQGKPPVWGEVVKRFGGQG